MNTYKNIDPFAATSRVEIIKPQYNDTSTLSFLLNEDKRCLRVDETFLSFSVRLPICYMKGLINYNFNCYINTY